MLVPYMPLGAILDRDEGIAKTHSAQQLHCICDHGQHPAQRRQRTTVTILLPFLAQSCSLNFGRKEPKVQKHCINGRLFGAAGVASQFAPEATHAWPIGTMPP